jgi:DNA polymerase I-like protein with 3'-5' exonuclease and polymerase domains
MSEWTFKNEYPDLDQAKLIAFDTETCDPKLLTDGPGSIRKDGFICGFSIATDYGFRGYYPLRHEGGGNVENVEQTKKWLNHQLNLGIPIVGANLLYDCEWVKSDFGFDVKSPKYDVQVADPLLDENFSTYRLNALAERRLGLKKDEELLYTQGALFLGLSCHKKDEEERKKEIAEKVKSNLWKLPASFVGAYGETDAVLPIDIFLQQKKELEEAKLWDIFLLETRVLDLLLAMRFQGVPVDINKAEQVANELQVEYENELEKIKHRVGFIPDVWAAESLVQVCDKLGLKYEKTDKGNPSFEADWLDKQEHPIFKMILEARQLDRCGGVFIKNKIIGCSVNGKIHPQYWQVKNDKGGTVSGRFASSNPNAQQFPARNERLATKVRSLVIAEPGCKFCCFDYSQQEPRVTVHYASLLGLRGSDTVRQQYIDNPDTDYHQFVSDITQIERKTAKNINLGLAYGMGVKKFSEKYGKPYNEAKQLFNIYHNKLPYIKELSNYCERAAKQRGHIKTLLGRHCHFNLYGPPKWETGMKPLRKKEAIEKYGLPVMQYFTYKAMNRLIQGSSADMIKKAMLDCWDAGYLCHMTVHDELDFANINSDKQIKEIKEIMLTCVKLEVPLKLDVEIGPNWGELEKIKI